MGTKILTAEEYINNEIPKEIKPSNKNIEFENEDVRAKYRWKGHLHNEDMKAIIDSLINSFPNLSFEKVEDSNDSTSKYEIWKTTDKKNGEDSFLRLSGLHATGKPKLIWTLSDKDIIEKLHSASLPLYKNLRNKEHRVTVVTSSYNNWNSGATWSMPPELSIKKIAREVENEEGKSLSLDNFTGKPKPFLDSHYITIYLKNPGKRDKYNFKMKIPKISYDIDKNSDKKVDNLLSNLYKDILKDNVFMFCNEKRMYSEVINDNITTDYRINFEVSDLDFDEYKGVFSVLELADKIKEFFNDKNIKYKFKGEERKVMPRSVVNYPKLLKNKRRIYCTECNNSFKSENSYKDLKEHLKNKHNKSLEKMEDIEKLKLY